ncbi:hypothetical protein [Legionella spiritensis]|uniref:hypothetical protein n=1 Tax=Legionella spiritensis TaxID=452 RepID=UPI000F71DBE6|nr:hypothetical protein [Legionella spiritensis]VEG92043.1 Uncharacterised protein [Legionella spiritensis]
MNPLLELMKQDTPLALDDVLPGNASVQACLGGLFLQLTKALQPTTISRSPETFFSVDSFDTQLASIMNQPDLFAESLTSHFGIPNARFSHLRCYSNGQRAHWHAIYAELNNDGTEIARIVMTDSRTNSSGHGLTADQDRRHNEFLKSIPNHKITFTAGPEQPSGSSTCWLHGLANLASLAATGQVYQRKTNQPLGDELAALLPQPVVSRSDDKHNETQSNAIHPSTPVNYPDRLFQTRKNHTGEKNRLLSSPVQSSHSTCLPATLKVTGTSGLFLGAGQALAGALAVAAVFPLGTTLSIALLATGIALLLIGAALLIGGCYVTNERLSEQKTIKYA